MRNVELEEAFISSTAASGIFRFKDVVSSDAIPAVFCGTVFDPPDDVQFLLIVLLNTNPPPII